jgi:UDP-3-O-[3-hydroxymyristoyl] glucosamine N-acyltransferase
MEPVMSGVAPISGDPRFFERSGPFTLQAVAEAAQGTLVAGEVSPQQPLHGVGPLQSAGAGEVSFLDNRKYAKALAGCAASAVIVHPDMQAQVPRGCAAIVMREPYLGWARVAALFHPVPPARPGVHPTAIIDPAAEIDPSAEIGPYAVIGPQVRVGPGCRIGIGAVLDHGVSLGADCRIGAHVSVSHAIIGSRVQLFPGVRIGQDGFGFATTMTPQGPRHVSLPQLGRVVIGDDVEVGANACIDRGSAQDTVIGAGTRIDNLVQIGHNVRLGRCCVIVAQVGISGSTVFEDFVVAAGQVGVAGHVRVGRGARLGGQAGVMSDIPAGAEVMGSPAQPAKVYFRQVAALRRLSGAKGKSNISAADTTMSAAAQGTVSD